MPLWICLERNTKTNTGTRVPARYHSLLVSSPVGRGLFVVALLTALSLTVVRPLQCRSNPCRGRNGVATRHGNGRGGEPPVGGESSC